MIIRRPDDIASSEITPERDYLRRREFVRAAGLAVAGALVAPRVLAACASDDERQSSGDVTSAARDDDKPNTYEEITSYNNYYEFGTDKTDPHDNAGGFHPAPWRVRVDGLCRKGGDYALDDLLKPQLAVERVYRLRCVEAWSMVIPWQGIPLADMLKRFEPQPGAKFVAFTTVFRPSEMPGQRRPVLPWPYVEGLRMDEAMHPLTLMATGLYGKPLPNQNGAPIRLVVPWKYGFKGIKSIVRISFVDRQPPTTWNIAAPDEYGFYANVNPTVDHPRWTQARERRIGEFRRRATLMFNGYADQVASMYAGMDLRANY
ncbi:MAG TPA: protein-methionine-sulfoxide reductase catalytic subunit MsrP [Gemmatimonadaceae bacterium]|nr:protein-methionine-sulfoxide reductase catalytic subunit MsrP [Gemmatimonadaceae bacterium]